MNTTLIMNASEGRIQFVLEQEGSLACAQEWSAPSKGTELLTPALADAFQRGPATWFPCPWPTWPSASASTSPQ